MFLNAASFHAQRARAFTAAVVKYTSTGIHYNLPFYLLMDIWMALEFLNSYCTLLSPNAGEARPSADFRVLALIATRCRGLLPVLSMLHSLVLDLIVAERLHSVFEYGHMCLVLKPGCVFIYFKKNCDYIVWNGGEMCQVRQASLAQFLVRFGCSVHVELHSAMRTQWL